MELIEKGQLFLFILFFLPGFISSKVYGLIFPIEEQDYSKKIYEIFTYSSINYAFWSWLIIIIYKNNYLVNCTWFFIVVHVLILFISPIIWPFLYKWISQKRVFNKIFINPYFKPWDYYFDKVKNEGRWLLITLKDGTMIGGYFGDEAFASSYPSDEQLYLNEVWKIDENGVFLEKIEGTDGVLIFKDQILTVEFYKN